MTEAAGEKKEPTIDDYHCLRGEILALQDVYSTLFRRIITDPEIRKQLASEFRLFGCRERPNSIPWVRKGYSMCMEEVAGKILSGETF